MKCSYAMAENVEMCDRGEKVKRGTAFVSSLFREKVLANWDDAKDVT